MKFLIVIPAHNEADNIAFCLESLQYQNFKNFDCIVVNDGSTDSTVEISEEIIKVDYRFKIINLSTSKHEPGAKVVRTFYKGLDSIDLADYDIICKYDADIVFPNNYLERIKLIFDNNPKVGLASGLVYIKKNSNVHDQTIFDFSNIDSQWIFENLSSKNHVRGPIKAYKKECLNQMDGLRPVLGWDNLDVLLAKKSGWEVETDKTVWVKHLRPTAYLYKAKKAKKLGQYFYNIGLNLPLAIISSAKSSFKNKSFSEFFITISTFLNQKEDRVLTKEEIVFIRNLRWKEFFKNFGL